MLDRHLAFVLRSSVLIYDHFSAGNTYKCLYFTIKTSIQVGVGACESATPPICTDFYSIFVLY
jgi:hypothetical protein